MAVQIISDLGLHLNLELEYLRLGTRGGKDDDVTILRRNLFWSANTIDTYEQRPSISLPLTSSSRSRKTLTVVQLVELL